MKQLILSITFIAISALTFGQCDATFDFGDELWGVAPDTITNLNDGQINSVYAQQVDVLVPENSEAFGIPFTIDVDSASLFQVSGLPDGLTFECNSPLTTPCTWLGGEQGCGVISGIPTEAGVFELDIQVRVFYTLVQAASIDVDVEGYRIEISDPLSDGLTESDTEFILYPNPARTDFEVRFNYDHSEEIRIVVYDIVGKETLSVKHYAQPGENKFNIPIEELREGTYLVRIEGLNQSTTKRLVVHN